MMEERPIELRIESAEDLKQVKWSGQMSPYAEAWVYPNHKVATRACSEGGRNPRWNDKLELLVAEHHLRDPNMFLTIDIMHHGSLGRKTVGTVRVPLTELSRQLKEPQRLSYQVRRRSGRPQGVLNFVVTVGEKREVPHAAAGAWQQQQQQQQQQPYMQGKQQPVTAYPAGFPLGGQQPYPPQGMYQQPQYAPYPSMYGAAPGGMYGYPMKQPRRQGGMGGMGMGLGAGLLGGLLLGEAFDNDYGDCGGDFGGGDFGGGDFGD